MEQTGRSLMQRIRSVKSSLENAEQSFKENQDMRGELDLMLAEAEMKNLRRRQAVPWNWNRQTLALCVACMLALAGFGGWYWAQGGDSYEAAADPVVTAAEALPYHDADKQQPQQRQAAVINQNNHSSSNAAGSGGAKEAESARAQLSEQEMWRLVRSARAELSNAN